MNYAETYLALLDVRRQEDIYLVCLEAFADPQLAKQFFLVLTTSNKEGVLKRFISFASFRSLFGA